MPANQIAELNAKNRAIAEYRISIQREIIRRDQWQTCLNCENFTESYNQKPAKRREGDPDCYCTKFKAQPPTHVIVNGCPDHEMEIPF